MKTERVKLEVQTVPLSQSETRSAGSTPKSKKSCRRSSTPAALRVASDIDGFKWIGYRVQIVLRALDIKKPSTWIWADGIAKYWYPKYRRFFVHLIENSSTDSEASEPVSSCSPGAKQGHFEDERCSTIANERGWFSVTFDHLRVISQRPVWKRPTAFGDSKRPLHDVCAGCTASLSSQPASPASDIFSSFQKKVYSCGACGCSYHARCLLPHEKKFYAGLSETELCGQAKAHRQFLRSRTRPKALKTDVSSSEYSGSAVEGKGWSERLTRQGVKRSWNSQPKQSASKKRCPLKRGTRVKSSSLVSSESEADETPSSNSTSSSSEDETLNVFRSTSVPDTHKSSPLSNIKEEPPHSDGASFANRSCLPSRSDAASGSNDGSSEIGVPSTPISVESWLCPKCIRCNYCCVLLQDIPQALQSTERGIWDLGDRDTLTTIVVCKSCGLAAHGVCCFPPVPQLHPNARWRCDNCSVCRSCGYRDAHWTDYTVWDATFSYCAKCFRSLEAGMYCGECRKAWDTVIESESETQDWIYCNGCGLWIHKNCDQNGVQKQNDVSLLVKEPTFPSPVAKASATTSESSFSGGGTRTTYRCPVCRGPDKRRRYLRILERAMVMDKKRDFSYPVPKTFLSYWRVVKSPMNFTEMKLKVFRDSYSDDDEFLIDFYLVLHNAKLAHMPNTRIHRNARALEKRGGLMAASVLGRPKLNRTDLGLLHAQVAQLASVVPKHPPFITDIQHCYDLEIMVDAANLRTLKPLEPQPPSLPFLGSPALNPVAANETSPLQDCSIVRRRRVSLSERMPESPQSFSFMHEESNRYWKASNFASRRLRYTSGAPAPMVPFYWLIEAPLSANSYNTCFSKDRCTPHPCEAIEPTWNDACDTEFVAAYQKSVCATRYALQDAAAHATDSTLRVTVSQLDNILFQLEQHAQWVHFCISCCCFFVQRIPLLRVKSPLSKDLAPVASGVSNMGFCPRCVRCTVCRNLLREAEFPSFSHFSRKRVLDLLAQVGRNDEAEQKSVLFWLMLSWDRALSLGEKSLGAPLPRCWGCHSAFHVSCLIDKELDCERSPPRRNHISVSNRQSDEPHHSCVERLPDDFSCVKTLSGHADSSSEVDSGVLCQKDVRAAAGNNGFSVAAEYSLQQSLNPTFANPCSEVIILFDAPSWLLYSRKNIKSVVNKAKLAEGHTNNCSATEQPLSATYNLDVTLSQGFENQRFDTPEDCSRRAWYMKQRKAVFNALYCQELQSKCGEPVLSRSSSPLMSLRVDSAFGAGTKMPQASILVSPQKSNGISNAIKPLQSSEEDQQQTELLLPEEKLRRIFAEDTHRWPIFCDKCLHPLKSVEKPFLIPESNNFVFSILNGLLVSDLAQSHCYAGTQPLSEPATVSVLEFQNECPEDRVNGSRCSLAFEAPHLVSSVSDSSTEQTDGSSPLLICRGCGVATQAWSFDDLRNLHGSMTHIPFLCSACQEATHSKAPTTCTLDHTENNAELFLRESLFIPAEKDDGTPDSDSLLEAFLCTIKLILHDLRTRLRYTADVRRLLTALAHCYSPRHPFLDSSSVALVLQEMMDSPIFYPYRCSPVGHDYSHSKIVSESVLQPDKNQVPAEANLPLLQRWLAEHLLRHTTRDYMFTRTTLTLLRQRHFPLQTSSTSSCLKTMSSGTEEEREDSVKVCTLNGIQCSRLLYWTAQLPHHKRALEQYLRWVCSFSQVSANEATEEARLLLGLFFYLSQQLYAKERNSASDAQIHAVLNEAHKHFFTLPNDLECFLNILERLSQRLTFDVTHHVINVLTRQLNAFLVTLVRHTGLSPSVTVSPNICQLCFSESGSILLGPLRVIRSTSRYSERVLCVHQECLLWSLCRVSRDASLIKGISSQAFPFFAGSSVESSSRFLLPVPPIDVPDALVKLFVCESRHNICALCEKPGAGVSCFSCKQTVVHLPCLFHHASLETTKFLAKVDFFSRLLMSCHRCAQNDGTPSHPTVQLPFCLPENALQTLLNLPLSLLRHFLQPVIFHTSSSFFPAFDAELTSPVALPPAPSDLSTVSVHLKDILPKNQPQQRQKSTPYWLLRRLKMLTELLAAGNVSSTTLETIFPRQFCSTSNFEVARLSKNQQLSKDVSTLWHPSAFKLVACGTTFTAEQNLSLFPKHAMQLPPDGFCSFRRYWDTAKLESLLSDTTSSNQDHDIVSSMRVWELFSTYRCTVTRSNSSLPLSYSLYKRVKVPQRDALDDGNGTITCEEQLVSQADAVEKCVGQFYDNLLPALSTFLGRWCGIKERNLVDVLLSPAEFFGLCHPEVVEKQLAEKRIHKAHAVLNGVIDLSEKPSVGLPINITKLTGNFRSRLWVAFHPPRRRTKRELGEQQDYVFEYSSSEVPAPQHWHTIAVERGVCVFSTPSSSEFPVKLNVHRAESTGNKKPMDTGATFSNPTNSAFVLPDNFGTASLSSPFEPFHAPPSKSSSVMNSISSRRAETGYKPPTLGRFGRYGAPRQKFDRMPQAVQYRYLMIMELESRVQARLSPIHGMGLFAVAPIPKGEPVVEYVGHVIRNVVADKREQLYELQGSKDAACYMFRLDSNSVVDATTAGNVARFINHSCEPNCICRVITSESGSHHIVIFASRDIRPGDEITYDYKFNVEEESLRIVCQCGAPSCLGRMN